MRAYHINSDEQAKEIFNRGVGVLPRLPISEEVTNHRTRDADNHQIQIDIDRSKFLLSDDCSYEQVSELILTNSAKSDKQYTQGDLCGRTQWLASSYTHERGIELVFREEGTAGAIISSIAVMLPSKRMLDAISSGVIEKENLPVSPHLLGVSYAKDHTSQESIFWINEHHTELTGGMEQYTHQYTDTDKLPKNPAVKQLLLHMIKLVRVGAEEELSALSDHLQRYINLRASAGNTRTIEEATLLECLATSKADAQPITTLGDAFFAAQHEITSRGLLNNKDFNDLLENAKAHIRKHPEQNIEIAIKEACKELPLDKAGLVLDILLTLVTLGFYRALNQNGLFCHNTRRGAAHSLIDELNKINVAATEQQAHQTNNQAATEQEGQNDSQESQLHYLADTFMSNLDDNDGSASNHRQTTHHPH